MKELKGAVQVDFDPVMSKNECVVKFASGSEIHIKEANILHLRVDAIVSPGNSALSNASGLANIISLNVRTGLVEVELSSVAVLFIFL